MISDSNLNPKILLAKYPPYTHFSKLVQFSNDNGDVRVQYLHVFTSSVSSLDNEQLQKAEELAEIIDGRIQTNAG